MANMGYSNTDAVYENVLSKGLLLKNTKSREPSHKGELVAIPNSTAESVLLYLAHRTRNMDAASDDPSKILPRYYFGGYDSIVQER